MHGRYVCVCWLIHAFLSRGAGTGHLIASVCRSSCPTLVLIRFKPHPDSPSPATVTRTLAGGGGGDEQRLPPIDASVRAPSLVLSPPPLARGTLANHCQLTTAPRPANLLETFGVQQDEDQRIRVSSPSFEERERMEPLHTIDLLLTVEEEEEEENASL